MPDLLDVFRRAVRSRCFGLCEGCGVGGALLDVHHRQARGAGGVHGAAAVVANDPRNGLALCRLCHDMTEHADEWRACIAMGLRVEHAYPHDPRGVPALLSTPQGRGWWLLTTDVGYQWVDWPRTYRMTADDLHGQTWLRRTAADTVSIGR